MIGQVPAGELEQLLRRLIRELVREELAAARSRGELAETDPGTVDDVEQLAAARAAKLRSARTKRGGR